MKYYNIGRTNEIEVIGFYPQATRTSKTGYHIDAFNSEKNVKSDNFPDFEPNYALDLNPKAKETDFLDSGSLNFGFVVSEKLKELLTGFNLPPHRFYPIHVYDSHNDYFWFHFITGIKNYLCLKETEVEIFDIFSFKILDTLRFGSFDELMERKRKSILEIGKPMRYKTITLNSNFPKYDLFEVIGAQNFTLISSNLKERLQQEKITGYEIIEYENIKTSSKHS